MDNYNKISARFMREDMNLQGLADSFRIVPNNFRVCEQVMSWYNSSLRPIREYHPAGVDTMFVSGDVTLPKGQGMFTLTQDIATLFLHMDNVPRKNEYTIARRGVLFHPTALKDFTVRDLRSLLYCPDIANVLFQLR